MGLIYKSKRNISCEQLPFNFKFSLHILSTILYLAQLIYLYIFLITFDLQMIKKKNESCVDYG